MHEPIANIVYPIFDYGLSLHDQLANGAPLDFREEQTTLKKMLLSESEAQCWPDYHSRIISAKCFHSGKEGPIFTGIRYALTCWLDELFIRFSPWAGAWRHHTLESSLYGGNDGHWKFWQQAHEAEARPGTDALEAFYLCVLLGFRGDLGKEPERLQDWIAAAQARLAEQKQNAWQAPPELEPPTHVPPLVGREKLRSMVVFGGMTILALIPLLVFFVARHVEP